MAVSKIRRAKAGETRVVVIEKSGILTAIVTDPRRGEVEIPLGVVEPLRRRAG